MASKGSLPHEIHIYGNRGEGRCVLVREGHDDIDLSAIFAVTGVEAAVAVGSLPKVKLEIIARLIHEAT
jgi:hypothetical protein